MDKKISKIYSGLNGEITIPSDKSISHRAIIFSCLAEGTSVIKNFSNGKDPLTSLDICKKLGANIEFRDNLYITSTGKLTPSENTLYCGNSGTTMRLMTGILAGQNFNSILTGDESLSARPMKRIITPLSLMGAKIISNNEKAPLKIYGQNLNGIDYKSPIASAQVKSSVLLAGLFAQNKTTFTEPHISRNHTELMLKYMGADIATSGLSTSIFKSELIPQTFEIPGDISSAAYYITAALLIPKSKIILKNVGLNPTRTGILDVVQKMGGNIIILDKRNISGEDVGDIQISYSNLNGCTIEGEIIPRLIDEIPAIAVLATQAEGTTIIKDAQDLRNKESDRIKAIANELKKLQADIQETPDGLIIHGKKELEGGIEVDSHNDHRIAMSLYVAGLICKKEINIKNFEWVNISLPEFENLFDSLIL